MRLAAGYSYEEIAVVLEVHRADIQHLELPKGGVTKGWLSGQNELEQSRRLLGPGVVLESEVARAIRAGNVSAARGVGKVRLDGLPGPQDVVRLLTSARLVRYKDACEVRTRRR
jgi:hypothetical protein